MSAPELRYGRHTPAMAAGGNIKATTASTGTNFTAFGAQPCAQLTIVNDSGTTIEWKQGSGTVYLPVADGANFSIFGIEDASDISVRRKDTSNTQVDVKARWEH